MTNAVQEDLADQLKSEVRTCPQCMYIVMNPFIERCPRCDARLGHLDLFCSGCIHSSVCPALAVKEKGAF